MVTQSAGCHFLPSLKHIQATACMDPSSKCQPLSRAAVLLSLLPFEGHVDRILFRPHLIRLYTILTPQRNQLNRKSRTYSKSQMASRHAMNPSHQGSAAKENIPPKMAKQKVSIGGLFTQQHEQRNKSSNGDGGIFAPKHSGISKAASAKPVPFSQYRKPKKSERHPIYVRFAGS